MDIALTLALFAFMLFMVMAFAGLASSWTLLKGWKPGRAVLAGSLGAAVFFGILFSYLAGGTPGGAQALVRKTLEQVEKGPVPPPLSSTPEAVQTYRNFCKDYLVLCLPSWAALGCLVVGLMAYYLTSRSLNRVTPRVPRPIPAHRWVVPEPMVFGLIGGGILKLWGVWFEGGRAVDLLGNNLLVFFIGLYTLGGLSIISFFLNKWRLPAALRVVSYILLFQLLFESICALGVLDVWFDFRKLKAPPTEAAS